MPFDFHARRLAFPILFGVFGIVAAGCSSPEPGPETSTAENEPEIEESAELLYSPEAFLMAAHDGKHRVVEVCLESGMDVNETNADGFTPLAMAAYNGHDKIVELLIKNKAEVDTPDLKGNTPLSHAASCGEASAPRTVKVLLDAGAEINAVDNGEHFTALMMAAAEGNLEVVKLLLEEGADKSMVDTDGESAAHFARLNGHTEIVELLEAE